MARKFKKNDIVLIHQNGKYFMGVVMSTRNKVLHIQYDWNYGVLLKDYTNVYKIGEL